MFEDSLVTSRVAAGLPKTRWLTAGSLLLQATLAACWILYPLFRPERLPLAAALLQPLPLLRLQHPAPAPPPLKVVSTQRASDFPSAASATDLPARIASAPHSASLDAPEAAMLPLNMGIPGPLPGALVGGNPGPRVSVAAPAGNPAGDHLRLSTGVGAGMLLAPIRPTYPKIAELSHVEGAVVVEAVISKAGAIERAHVVSGPALLQDAALQSVLKARYRPYLLNGEPTEVETRFTVIFRLGRD